ncbi:uncharacterized protein CLAFUR5_05312 [Fulvia fulva]|uniref:Uncharacterized protein n=1 Tax=Passalora fulva TaxID=5499 RepID=A0A9Q8P7E8_PASFU|nr:uncharacterized protein CLAFUR5_05312 [Fulvia fulva]KAK4617140.1 hypothetical protein CLAFUR0_10709 [Fulvia fulva]UJO15946.1 hypothetical protein CLAFUR5_05312 [Fulvia fulva]
MRPPWSQPGTFDAGLLLSTVLLAKVRAAPALLLPDNHTNTTEELSALDVLLQAADPCYEYKSRPVDYTPPKCINSGENHWTMMFLAVNGTEDCEKARSAVETRLQDLHIGQHNVTCINSPCSPMVRLDLKVPSEALGPINDALHETFSQVPSGDDGVCVPLNCLVGTEWGQEKNMTCATEFAESVKVDLRQRSSSNPDKRASNITMPPLTAACKLGPSWYYMRINVDGLSDACNCLTESVEQDLTGISRKQFRCTQRSEDSLVKVWFNVSEESRITEFNHVLQQTLPDVMFGDRGLCIPKKCYTDEEAGLRNMTCAYEVFNQPVKVGNITERNLGGDVTRYHNKRNDSESTAPSPTDQSKSKTAHCELFKDFWDIYIFGGYDNTICDRIHDLSKEMLPKYLARKSLTCGSVGGEGNGQITLPTTEPERANTFNEVLQQAMPDVSFGETGLCVPRVCYQDFRRGIKNMTCAQNPPPPSNSSSPGESRPYGHNMTQFPKMPNTAVCTINDFAKFNPTYPTLDIDPRVDYDIGVGAPFSEDICNNLKQRINGEVSGYVVDCNKAEPIGVDKLNKIVEESFPDVDFSGNGTCWPSECYYANGTFHERIGGRKAAIKILNETCIAGQISTVSNTPQANLTESAATGTNGTLANTTETNTTEIIKQGGVIVPRTSDEEALAILPNRMEPNTAICYDRTEAQGYAVIVKKPWSAAECARVEQESSGIDFSCGPDGIWTAYLEGDTAIVYEFEEADEKYDQINERLQAAYPDVKFEGAGLCTSQDCYLPTFDEAIYVRNMACGVGLSDDSNASGTSSTGTDIANSTSPEPSVNSSLAPLPDEHIAPNTAVCFGQVRTGGFMVVVGRPLPEGDCLRLRHVFDIDDELDPTFHEFGCAEGAEWTSHFEGEAVTQVMFGSGLIYDFNGINEKLGTALPGVKFEGSNLCARPECYLPTSDEHLSVRNVSCAMTAPVEQAANTTLPEEAANTSLPGSEASGNSALAPLPPRVIAPNSALCLGDGTSDGYTIIVDKPHEPVDCEDIAERLANGILRPDGWEVACYDADNSYLYYFQEQPVLEISVGNLESWDYVELNKRLKEALPDVDFNGLGACDDRTCYLETSISVGRVRNTTCGGGTELFSNANSTSSSDIPVASRPSIIQASTTEANTTHLIKREDVPSPETLAPLPDKHIEPNTALCLHAGEFYDYSIIVGKPFEGALCERIEGALADGGLSLKDDTAWSIVCRSNRMMIPDYFKDEPVTAITVGEISSGEYRELNRKLREALSEVNFDRLGTCEHPRCYLPTSDEYIWVRNTSYGHGVDELPTIGNVSSVGELADLPDKHLEANRAICWNEGTESGQYRITVADPFEAEKCKKVQEVINSHFPKEVILAGSSSISCVEPGADDWFKDQREEVTVLYTTLNDSNVQALNNGLCEAYPDIDFPPFGLCAPYHCYDQTLEPRIKVENITCTADALEALRKRTHMPLLAIDLNGTLILESGRAASVTAQNSASFTISEPTLAVETVPAAGSINMTVPTPVTSSAAVTGITPIGTISLVSAFISTILSPSGGTGTMSTSSFSTS